MAKQRRSSSDSSKSSYSPPPVTNFEFLNISNPNQAKSERARRQVRSHVTKQQHFRDQLSLSVTGQTPCHWPATSSDAGSTPTNLSRSDSPSNPSSQAPSPGAAAGSSARPRSRKASSSSSTTTTMSNSTSIPVGFNARDGSNGDDLGSDLALLREAMYEQPAIMNSSPDSAVHAHGMPVPTTTRIDMILWYPPPWQSSVQKLLTHYSAALAPRQPFFPAERGASLLHDVWMPFVLSSQMTMNAVLLLASAHFQLANGVPIPAIDIDELKSMALCEVTSSLSLQAERPSDELIATVLLLAQYEIFTGNAQTFHVHMSGLRKLVQARGNLRTVGIEGVERAMLLWLVRESGISHPSPPLAPTTSTSPGAHGGSSFSFSSSPS